MGSQAGNTIGVCFSTSNISTGRCFLSITTSYTNSENHSSDIAMKPENHMLDVVYKQCLLFRCSIQTVPIIHQNHMLDVVYKQCLSFRCSIQTVPIIHQNHMLDVVYKQCLSFIKSYDSLCLIIFHLLARKPNLEKFPIYSNKFFHNFD